MEIKIENVKVELFKEPPDAIQTSIASGAGYARIPATNGTVVDFEAIGVENWGEVTAAVPLSFRETVEHLEVSSTSRNDLE